MAEEAISCFGIKTKSDGRERWTEIDNESMIGYKCAFMLVVRWLVLVYAICYTIYFLPHTHVVVRPLLFMSFGNALIRSPRGILFFSFPDWEIMICDVNDC